MTVFLTVFNPVTIFFSLLLCITAELPQPHDREEREVQTQQQPWNEERNSTEDLKEPESPQEPPVPPQEKQEELCSAQLVLKQEPDGLASTPVRQEIDESEGQTPDWNPCETVNMPVISSVVSARDLEAELNSLFSK